MKLIYCSDCEDIVRLYPGRPRQCGCGRSWGRYTTSLQAEYGGSAYPIGFNNESLVSSLSRQPEEGTGERFEAFVIPKNCPTMIRKKERP